MIVVVIGEAWGLWTYSRTARVTLEDELQQETSWERRVLLSGGTVLVLLGFLYGAWYAGMNLYGQEARERKILGDVLDAAVASSPAAAQSVNAYGMLAAEKAVEIAAHSHIIEFGLLAILLSFISRTVFFETCGSAAGSCFFWRGRSFFPFFVFFESNFGLVPGGIADLGGLMVIVALMGMLVGVLRHSGRIDAQAGGLS